MYQFATLTAHSQQFGNSVYIHHPNRWWTLYNPNSQVNNYVRMFHNVIRFDLAKPGPINSKIGLKYINVAWRRVPWNPSEEVGIDVSLTAMNPFRRPK